VTYDESDGPATPAGMRRFVHADPGLSWGADGCPEFFDETDRARAGKWNERRQRDEYVAETVHRTSRYRDVGRRPQLEEMLKRDGVFRLLKFFGGDVSALLAAINRQEAAEEPAGAPPDWLDAWLRPAQWARFRANIVEEAECWLWKDRDRSGLPKPFERFGDPRRFVVETFLWPIPGNAFGPRDAQGRPIRRLYDDPGELGPIRPTCGRRACVAPWHLEALFLKFGSYLTAAQAAERLVDEKRNGEASAREADAA
jgi:hypothetical protein